MHSLKHYKVLHEHNVLLTIETAQTPRVRPEERVRIEPISDTFARVVLRFGFMETPNVPRACHCKKAWLAAGMSRWQDRLFITLARAANDATDYFQIPTGRVVEVGTQVTV
jgi:KUP system potassium uptake protein